MLDITGAIVLTAILAAQATVLAGLSRTTPRNRLGLFSLALAWTAAVVAIGARGGFAPGVLGPVPAPVLAFALLLAMLLAAWRLAPPFRDLLLSIPLHALVGLNAARLAGVFFLLLAAGGRLSNPFAASAGWGDIAVGGLAAALIFGMATRGVPRWSLRIWNILGTTDLVLAVLLGGLSAQGAPWLVFTDSPGSLAITQLPWVLIPAMIVPIYFLIHFVIGVRLRKLARETRRASLDLVLALRSA
jgi:hypothetical protein